MKLPNTAIMLDMESTDNVASSAILSIGAVAFNKESVDPMQFYIAIKLESCLALGMTINSDTMDFWRKQSPEAQSVFFDQNAVDITTALQAFSNWARIVTDNNSFKVKLFGNGAAFDGAMIEQAFRTADVKSPFAFWNILCYRSWKAAYPKVKMVREDGGKSASHNALVDAREQANHLIEINKTAGGIIL